MDSKETRQIALEGAGAKGMDKPWGKSPDRTKGSARVWTHKRLKRRNVTRPAQMAHVLRAWGRCMREM